MPQKVISFKDCNLCPTMPSTPLMFILKKPVNKSINDLIQIKRSLFQTQFISPDQPSISTVSKWIDYCGFDLSSQKKLIQNSKVKPESIYYFIALFLNSDHPFFTSHYFPLDSTLLSSIQLQWFTIRDTLLSIKFKQKISDFFLRLFTKSVNNFYSLPLLISLCKSSTHPIMLVQLSSPHPRSLSIPIPYNEFVQTAFTIASNNGFRALEHYLNTFTKFSDGLPTVWDKVFQTLPPVHDTPLLIDTLFHCFSDCLSKVSGTKPFESLLFCFLDKNSPSYELYKKTFFSWLCTLINLSPITAIKYFRNCIAHDGGHKNIHALMECFFLMFKFPGKESECTLFTFISETYHLPPSRTVQFLFDCMGHIGGTKNKHVLLSCFMDSYIFPKIDKKMTFFDFLCKPEGVGILPINACSMIEGSLGVDGGSNNLKALLSCFIDKHHFPERPDPLTFYEFLIYYFSSDSHNIHLLTNLFRCSSHHGGMKNIKSLLECFLKKIPFPDNKKPLTFFEFLCSIDDYMTSPLDAIYFLFSIVYYDSGSHNLTAILNCITERYFIPHTFLKVSVFKFLSGDPSTGVNQAFALHFFKTCIGHENGARNTKSLLSCFLKKHPFPFFENETTIFNWLYSDVGGRLSFRESAIYLQSCIGYHDAVKSKSMLFNSLLEPISYPGLPKVDLFSLLLTMGFTNREALYPLYLVSRFYKKIQTSDLLSLLTPLKTTSNHKCILSLLHDHGIQPISAIIRMSSSVDTYRHSKNPKHKSFSSISNLLQTFFVGDTSFYNRIRSVYSSDISSLNLMVQNFFSFTLNSVSSDTCQCLTPRFDFINNWYIKVTSSPTIPASFSSLIFTIQSFSELQKILSLTQKIIKHHPVILNHLYIIQQFPSKILSSLEYFLSNKTDIYSALKSFAPEFSDGDACLAYLHLSNIFPPRTRPLPKKTLRNLLKYLPKNYVSKFFWEDIAYKDKIFKFLCECSSIPSKYQSESSNDSVPTPSKFNYSYPDKKRKRSSSDQELRDILTQYDSKNSKYFLTDSFSSSEILPFPCINRYPSCCNCSCRMILRRKNIT